MNNATIFLACFLGCLLAIVVVNVAKWQTTSFFMRRVSRIMKGNGSFGDAGIGTYVPLPSSLPWPSDSPDSNAMNVMMRVLDADDDLKLAAIDYGDDPSVERANKLVDAAFAYHEAMPVENRANLRSMAGVRARTKNAPKCDHG